MNSWIRSGADAADAMSMNRARCEEEDEDEEEEDGMVDKAPSVDRRVVSVVCKEVLKSGENMIFHPMELQHCTNSDRSVTSREPIVREKVAGGGYDDGDDDDVEAEEAEDVE